MTSKKLRQGAEVIVDLGDSGAWVVESGHEQRLSLRSVAYGANGELLTGPAARARQEEAPECGVGDVVDRIGDSVPVVVAGRAVAAEDLVAEALSAVLGDRSAVALLLPADWGPHRQALIRQALEDVGVDNVRVVPAPLATLDIPEIQLPTVGGVLVLDAGERHLRAALVALEAGAERRLGRVAAADLGGSDVDEALVSFVRTRLPGPVTDGAGLLEACRHSREELSLAPAVELSPPGGEPLRLVRAELDALVGDRLRRTIADLLDRLGPEPIESVVLTGGLARMPLLVEIASSLVDRPVQVPTDPALAAARGAHRSAAVRTAETALPTVVEPPTVSEPATSLLPRRTPLASLRRYSGLAAAAATFAVVLSAPLAFPGLDAGLSSASLQGQSDTPAVAESRSAEDNASGSAAQGTDEGAGPLRRVADLFTPGPAVAQERQARVASPTESTEPTEPMRALADRTAGTSPPVRPSNPTGTAQRSTVPSSTPATQPAVASPQPVSAETETAQPAPTEAPPTTAPPTTAPPETTAPESVAPETSAPETAAPTAEPTTAPPTTEPPATQAPAPAVRTPAPAAATTSAAAESATAASETADAGAV